VSRHIAPMRGLALRQEQTFDAKFDDEFMKERCCPLKVRSAKSGHVQCTFGNVRFGSNGFVGVLEIKFEFKFCNVEVIGVAR
jgi:hypothetical protein